MKRALARSTLDRARWFQAQSAAAETASRDRFAQLFDAGIVFGRSVTFHLQKEFRHSEGFDDWYSQCQEGLRDDPLAKFFLDTRNFVLKQGPTSFSKNISIAITEGMVVGDLTQVTVKRGSPWHRRPPRTLVDDAADAIRTWRNKFRDRRAQSVAARSRSDSSGPGDSMRFADAAWSDRPAVDLLAEYLDTLERLVSDAESLFGDV